MKQSCLNSTVGARRKKKKNGVDSFESQIHAPRCILSIVATRPQVIQSSELRSLVEGKPSYTAPPSPPPHMIFSHSLHSHPLFLIPLLSFPPPRLLPCTFFPPSVHDLSPTLNCASLQVTLTLRQLPYCPLCLDFRPNCRIIEKF